MQDEITDEQIEALRVEAAAHGDAKQEALCRFALALSVYRDRLAREVAERRRPRFIRSLERSVAYCERAWQECARVIADAKAQG